MKSHPLTLIAALLAVFLSSANAQTFLTNGLVAYYPFNGNANDASGSGNNGTVTGATLTQDRFGNTNSAYSFNGVNNYIGFSSVPTSQVDNWTMTAWVKPASLNQAQSIAVALGYDDGSSGNGYSLGVYVGQLHAVFGGVADLDGGFTFASTSQWYQVVMLRSSGVTTFYVNGVLTSSGNTASPITPAAFRIGSDIGLRYFSGAIDDVRVYNRALASNEVAQLYAYESPPPSLAFLTNGLVAYYPFNGNANDASGNGNNGTVSGATLVQDRYSNAGSAYSFNGIDNYISFASVPTSQVDNWTISTWVKLASLSQLSDAVSMGYDDGFSGNGYSLSVSTGTGGAFPGNQLFATFGGLGWANSGYSFASTSQWYHVVMLRSSGVTSFYVNSIQTSNTTTMSPVTPTSFRIGSENGLRFFNGAIDDVRIYNRALSSTEVSTLYAFESSGFCSPHAAQATPIVTNGFVVGATITDNGCGYTNPPLVLILGGGGSNATATATIQNGFVTSINIINPGAGYTTLPDILIGSPPFVPTLTINVSRVNVTQHVVLGLNYVLESSSDMIHWTATGPQFTAQSEEVTTEFVVNQVGQYFRIRQVP